MRIVVLAVIGLVSNLISWPTAADAICGRELFVEWCTSLLA